MDPSGSIGSDVGMFRVGADPSDSLVFQVCRGRVPTHYGVFQDHVCVSPGPAFDVLSSCKEGGRSQFCTGRLERARERERERERARASERQGERSRARRHFAERSFTYQRRSPLGRVIAQHTVLEVHVCPIRRDCLYKDSRALVPSFYGVGVYLAFGDFDACRGMVGSVHPPLLARATVTTYRLASALLDH